MDRIGPVIKSANGILIVACLVVVVVVTLGNRRKFNEIGLQTTIKTTYSQIIQNSKQGTFTYLSDGLCNANCLIAHNLVTKSLTKLFESATCPGDFFADGCTNLDDSSIGSWKQSTQNSRIHVEDSDNYAFAFKKSSTTYDCLFHYDTSFENQNTSGIQEYLNSSSYCGVDDDNVPLCNLNALVQKMFTSTSVSTDISWGTNLNWIIIEYPWFNQVSRERIKKRSIVVRVTDDIIIGAGYSVEASTFEPRERLTFAILGAFGLVAGLLFVLPGPYVDRSIYTMKKLLPKSSSGVVIFQTVVVSCLPLLIVGFVQGLRCLQIHKNDSTREELKQQDATTRETSVGMALLALSITLMSGLVPEERMNIVFSTVLAFVFSVISVMHLWRMNTNDEMYQSKQVREFSLNMAIMNLLYAFVLIITKYWNKYESLKSIEPNLVSDLTNLSDLST